MKKMLTILSVVILWVGAAAVINGITIDEVEAGNETDIGVLDVPRYTPKPYIYQEPFTRDPNRARINLKTDTVCSRHGRLDFGEKVRFLDYDCEDGSKSYCGRCIYEVLQIYLDKHIIPFIERK